MHSDNENCNFCGNKCEPGLTCKPDPARPTESKCQAPPPCYYDGHPRKTGCGGSNCCISDPFFGIVCALDTGTPDQRFCFCGPNGMGACSVTPPQ